MGATEALLEVGQQFGEEGPVAKFRHDRCQLEDRVGQAFGRPPPANKSP
jgi:hypothetical protein